MLEVLLQDVSHLLKRAILVPKTEKSGFFELARQLGHDIDDVEKFWISEVKKVFAAWQKK